MTKRSPKPCIHSGCGALVFDGSSRCDKHKLTDWRKRPESAKRVTGRRLQKLRNQLFDEQPLCVECQKQARVRIATERDHIIPLFEGGQDVFENTQALCKSCHDVKSKAERLRSSKFAGGGGSKV